MFDAGTVLVLLEREIDKKLVDGAIIGCFPNLYAALSGNMPDQIIAL